MPKKKINNSSSPMDKAEEEMQEDVGTVKHTEKKRQAKTSGEEREKGKAATKEKKVKATKGKARKASATAASLPLKARSIWKAATRWADLPKGTKVGPEEGVRICF